jgi:Protein of unknown function (DUF1257)
MSHITKINLLLKDLDAADKTAGRLGMELVRNQKTFKSYRNGQCDHVLRVKGNPNAYEIGLKMRADGKGYELLWDGGMYDNPLYSAVGYWKKGETPNVNKLKDWYAAEVARKQMARQGFQVKMTQGDRKVQVLCSK